MRTPLFLLLLFYSTISLSQGITVDTTTLGIPELVREELMQNVCANESNFKFSSHLGIGKFTNTNPNFPISDGIIIRNGIAKHTEGIYTRANESSQLNTANDSDLQTISDNNGQVVPITDVSYLQFDFTPLSSNFSFDFLFASNEYGEFQCGFSDVFAFILTVSSTVIPNRAYSIKLAIGDYNDSQYDSAVFIKGGSFKTTLNLGPDMAICEGEKYQMDDGNFQTSNIFPNVASGQHIITVKDTKGNCDNRVLVANVLKYPKFFTPNNDGFNDSWSILDLEFQPDAVVNIFDRYGKFLKELKPSGSGWDGNYNGNPLPSTDYWFQVFYTQNGISQVFKSHFSMKR